MTKPIINSWILVDLNGNSAKSGINHKWNGWEKILAVKNMVKKYISEILIAEA